MSQTKETLKSDRVAGSSLASFDLCNIVVIDAGPLILCITVLDEDSVLRQIVIIYAFLP